MQIDPAELMPEPPGFIAFKGEGNRSVVVLKEVSFSFLFLQVKKNLL